MVRRSLLLVAIVLVSLAAARGSATAYTGDDPHRVLDAGGVLAILSNSPDYALALSVEYDGFQLLLAQTIAPLGIRRAFDQPPKLELFAGIGCPQWGLGRAGSLLMSGRTPPMPIAGYRLVLRNAGYVRFAGLMESEQHRRLIGHRLEYSPVAGLRLGVSETAVVSNDASPLLYWPFPGLPLYALQRAVSQHDRSQDSLINVNFGADFAATLSSRGRRPQLEVYGELMIDDAQGSILSRRFVPDFLGALVGVRVPEFTADPRLGAGLEYVAIQNYVYSHRNPDCSYMYRGKGIGHGLGPDADLLMLAVDFRPNPRTVVSLAGAVERHGEGKIGHPWSPAEGANRRFLTGTVEKTAKVTLEVERTLIAPALIAGRLELGVTSNKDHVQGAAYKYWSAGIGLGIRL